MFFLSNHAISQERKINKTNYFSPEQIVQIALNNRCHSIAYTYNEPTIFFPYIKDVATLAKQYGLKNIMVTNGFESDEVINEMRGLIDAVNVDLKSYNHKYYKKLGGNLERIKSNLIKFKENNIWVEVTTLIIPDINDSYEELNNIASFISTNLTTSTPWHISAFHPDYKMLDKNKTPLNTLQKAYNIGKKHNLNYVYIGNMGLPNETICPYCQNIILKRIGYQTIIDNRLDNIYCSKCHNKIDGVMV